MDAPCKDCPDRKFGCHASCEKYAAFCDECKRINEERIKYKTSLSASRNCAFFYPRTYMRLRGWI